MIRYKGITPKGQIEVEQIGSRPTIYLDTWAIDLFSSNNVYGNKFTSILNKLGGTLTISFITLSEVVNRSDENQFLSICNFIDSVDGVFIDTNPSSVIKKEKELKGVNEINRYEACSDAQLLKAHVLYAHDPLKLFKMSEIFSQLRKERGESNNIMEEGFEKELFPPIKKCRNDPAALLRAKNRFKNKKMIKGEFPYTEDLYGKAIDFIAINETMKMPDKEWRDFCHVIVPVAYCDFVLTDKRWVQFIQSAGLKNIEIARVYSQKKLEDFFNDLEGWKGAYHDRIH